MNGQEFRTWLSQYPKTQSARPLVMGILNVTPDSFFDGAQHFTKEKAFIKAMSLVEEGVDLLDLGGESSRPGAEPVSAEQELERIIPVLQQLRQYTDVCISVDTYKSQVMQQALECGADWINDIFSLSQLGSLELIRHYDVPVCLLHMVGVPQSMGIHLNADLDIRQDVLGFFENKVQELEMAGIRRENMILDPGIGFGKTTEQDLMLIKFLSDLNVFSLPILLGVSRKKFIGQVLYQEPALRLNASNACNVLGYAHGARIFRTHDIVEIRDMLAMARAVLEVDNG